jgi:hypothetical protein
MFEIYKCEVRGKKEHIVKDESTTYGHIKESRQGTTAFSSYDLHRADKYYKNQKKINGKISGDYTLYYYDLKDIKSGKLFSMKTEHNIEVDSKPLYIGVEGDDIIAFSKNEINENKSVIDKKNYTVIESKSSNFTARDIFLGLCIFVMYMIPIISIATNFIFIKDMANSVKQDYKNYPALILKIVIGLIMLYQAKKTFIIATNSRYFSTWYDIIQSLTINTGLLSFIIVIGSICYFKWTRLKNLEQFNQLEKKGA